MHVVNAMFGCGLGGIEQSFIDYAIALKRQNIKVTALVHPKAAILTSLNIIGVNTVKVRNFSKYDIFAKVYLKKILKQIKPDIVIAHGNRAVSLLKKDCNSLQLPIVSVTHNYKLEGQIGADGFFATTNDLKAKLLRLSQKSDTIFDIPNMIDIKQCQPKEFGKVPVIGVMGRFVEEKAFDIFIDSLKILEKQEVKFKAQIAGNGKLENELKAKVEILGLSEKVKFLGWADDKNEFYENIDIFVLPSRKESFGIVLLEALMHGKAVVTTESDGPRQIVTNGHDALMVPIDDAKKMADAVNDLIKDKEKARNIGLNAIQTVQKYDINKVGTKIKYALETLVA